MKKSDIKNGMHVITNNGVEYVVIAEVEALAQHHKTNKLMIQLSGGNGGWMPLDDYDDDLHYHSLEEDKYNIDKNYDIKAVYAPKYYSFVFFHYYTDNFIKVWERPIVKKMTKSEIEAELGYEIEIVD